LDSVAISASNAATVSELLQQVAGLHISQQGGAGGISNLYLNGADPNFTVVLLNGIQLNDPTNTHGGSFDFSDLDIGSVERIEIVKGSQSAVYGSDALAGAINIITHSGAASTVSKVSLGFGNDGQRALGYQYSASLSEHSGLGLSIGRLDRGELVPGHTYESSSIDGRYYSDILSGNTKLQASLHYLSADRTAYPQDGGGPVFALSDDLDVGSREDRAVSIQLTHNVSDRWELGVAGQWFNHQEVNDSPGIVPFNFVPPNGRDSDFTRKQWTFNSRLSINENLRLGLGADLRQESGSSTGYLIFGEFELPTQFSIDRDITGTFVEAQFRKNVWVLNASARRDSGDDFGGRTTRKLAVAYKLSDSTTLNISWGEGFKLPSFFALADSLTGNPDLLPEESDSLVAGIAQQRETVSWNLDFYLRNYSNLIDFDANTFTHVNRSSVETDGVDFQMSWRYSERLDTKLFVSYTNVNVVGLSEPDRGFPKWRAGVHGRYQVRDDLQIQMSYLWVDTVFESSLVTGLVPLDPYALLSINLNWDYSEDWTFGFKINNLLDKDYQQAVGTPSPGRHARVSLEYRF